MAFDSKVQEHEPIFTSLVRESGSIVNEPLPRPRFSKFSGHIPDKSRLSLVSPEGPGPGYAFKGDDGIPLQLGSVTSLPPWYSC